MSILCTGTKKNGLQCRKMINLSANRLQPRCHQHYDEEMEIKLQRESNEKQEKREQERINRLLLAKTERQRKVAEYLALENYAGVKFINGSNGECKDYCDSDLDIDDHGVGVCDTCGKTGYVYLLNCGEAFCADNYNPNVQNSCGGHHNLYIHRLPKDLC